MYEQKSRLLWPWEDFLTHGKHDFQVIELRQVPFCHLSALIPLKVVQSNLMIRDTFCCPNRVLPDGSLMLASKKVAFLECTIQCLPYKPQFEVVDNLECR